ncbi:MAG: mercuric reductase [Planctomycetes bacterium]|nr:mercuric reductase [Planctomycetota bacterium]
MTETLRILPDDVHNQALLGHVRPSDWSNPEPAPCYHLVVIGAGTAGLVAAAGAAGLGASVALVEKHLMGGDCLNTGCVPSKALIRAARARAEVRDAANFGIRVPPRVEVDFAAAMQRMRRLRAEIGRNDSAARFRSLGVDVFLGHGRFVGADAIEVSGRSLRFRKAIVATGGRPAPPAIPGLAEVGFLTNETVFSLTELPQRLAVIGGGPIGCELAQTFARLGSRVTLLQRGRGILPREDRDAVQRLANSMGRDGVEIVVDCRVRRVEKKSDGKSVHLVARGSARELPVDEILVGAGRVPNVQGLDLGSAGVEYDDRQGVRVNDRLQTTNSRVYAAGDVCSRFKFTHAADAMARIVIRNALFRGRAKASALTIPWCTYTTPEIAHVGLYEHEADQRGIRVRTFVQGLEDVDRAILDGATEGFVKVLVPPRGDRILGATIVAESAGDMISELSVAMAGGLGLAKLANVIHPYPTQAEAIRRLGDAYNRTRLTPLAKSFFRKWFAWT